MHLEDQAKGLVAVEQHHVTGVENLGHLLHPGLDRVLAVLDEEL